MTPRTECWGILKTKAQAEAYVAEIFRLTGKVHIIFQVKPGTHAYQIGYRYGTCDINEAKDYKETP